MTDTPGPDRSIVPMAALASLAALVPFIVARIPPSTDLAQHVAQMRLVGEALRAPDGPYTVQWFAPNTLAYGFVAAGWALASPIAAGRVALAGIAVAWIAATAFLAHTRRRGATAVVVASVFLFSHVLYWGFLEFLVGWVAFAIFTGLATAKGRPLTPVRIAGLFAAAIALYLAHVLWLGAALGCVAIMSLADQDGARTTLRRIAPLVPVLIAAAAWSFHVRGERVAGGFDVGAHWYVPPWQRLAPAAFTDAAFGGLVGATEPMLLALVAVYVVAGAVEAKRKGGMDRGLLGASALLGAVALLAPDKYLNTASFAARWLPEALALLVLAVPPPAFRPSLLRALAVGGFVLFGLATAATWVVFDDEELDGFESALAAVPERARVVGLDFVRRSQLIKGEPFMQMFAYAQAIHGGTLNFSFAQHGSSPVRFRRVRLERFTPALEAHPARFSRLDLQYFDVALVNGPPPVHSRLSHYPGFVPVTTRGPWRLYRLDPGLARRR